jgi:multidrug efflux pump subunit AcrB
LQLKDSVAAARRAQQLLPGAQEARRHAPHAAAGRDRALLNDDFGDVYGTIYALPATASAPRTCAEHAEDVRARLLRVQGRGQGGVVRRAAEKVFVEISHKKLAQLGIDFSNQVIAQLNAQNAVEGAGLLNSPEGMSACGWMVSSAT